MKVHFRKALDAGGAVFGPYLTPQIPAIYDLLADPQEKNDIMETTMSDGWAIGAAMGPVVAFQESAKTLPPHQDRRRIHRLPELVVTAVSSSGVMRRGVVGSC
jgi:hypothetical protein